MMIRKGKIMIKKLSPLWSVLEASKEDGDKHEKKRERRS